LYQQQLRIQNKLKHKKMIVNFGEDNDWSFATLSLKSAKKPKKAKKRKVSKVQGECLDGNESKRQKVELKKEECQKCNELCDVISIYNIDTQHLKSGKVDHDNTTMTELLNYITNSGQNCVDELQKSQFRTILQFFFKIPNFESYETDVTFTILIKSKEQKTNSETQLLCNQKCSFDQYTTQKISWIKNHDHFFVLTFIEQILDLIFQYDTIVIIYPKYVKEDSYKEDLIREISERCNSKIDHINRDPNNDPNQDIKHDMNQDRALNFYKFSLQNVNWALKKTIYGPYGLFKFSKQLNWHIILYGWWITYYLSIVFKKNTNPVEMYISFLQERKYLINNHKIDILWFISNPQYKTTVNIEAIYFILPNNDNLNSKVFSNFMNRMEYQYIVATLKKLDKKTYLKVKAVLSSATGFQFSPEDFVNFEFPYESNSIYNNLTFNDLEMIDVNSTSAIVCTQSKEYSYCFNVVLDIMSKMVFFTVGKQYISSKINNFGFIALRIQNYLNDSNHNSNHNTHQNFYSWWLTEELDYFCIKNRKIMDLSKLCGTVEFISNVILFAQDTLSVKQDFLTTLFHNVNDKKLIILDPYQNFSGYEKIHKKQHTESKIEYSLADNDRNPNNTCKFNMILDYYLSLTIKEKKTMILRQEIEKSYGIATKEITASEDTLLAIYSNILFYALELYSLFEIRSKDGIVHQSNKMLDFEKAPEWTVTNLYIYYQTLPEYDWYYYDGGTVDKGVLFNKKNELLMVNRDEETTLLSFTFNSSHLKYYTINTRFFSHFISTIPSKDETLHDQSSDQSSITIHKNLVAESNIGNLTLSVKNILENMKQQNQSQEQNFEKNFDIRHESNNLATNLEVYNNYFFSWICKDTPIVSEILTVSLNIAIALKGIFQRKNNTNQELKFLEQKYVCSNLINSQHKSYKQFNTKIGNNDERNENAQYTKSDQFEGIQLHVHERIYRWMHPNPGEYCPYINQNTEYKRKYGEFSFPTFQCQIFSKKLYESCQEKNGVSYIDILKTLNLLVYNHDSVFEELGSKIISQSASINVDHCFGEKHYSFCNYINLRLEGFLKKKGQDNTILAPFTLKVEPNIPKSINELVLSNSFKCLGISDDDRHQLFFIYGKEPLSNLLDIGFDNFKYNDQSTDNERTDKLPDKTKQFLFENIHTYILGFSMSTESLVIEDLKLVISNTARKKSSNYTDIGVYTIGITEYTFNKLLSNARLFLASHEF
jgi:hypothetical protein